MLCQDKEQGSSLVDPIVYARRYVREAAADYLVQSLEWSELWQRMEKSVVIVCEAGADWLTHEVVRLLPESREEGFLQGMDVREHVEISFPRLAVNSI